MSSIKSQCTFVCGPYRDYCGRAVYDDESEIFHGEVIGTRDVITFQGQDPQELAQAFQDSVDDYIEFCQSTGQKPERPFSGKFVTRMSPELHQRISAAAQSVGLSLNQFICDCLEKMAVLEVPKTEKRLVPPKSVKISKRRQAGRSQGRKLKVAASRIAR
jgi:predicted HicB family RNase H-like nuclease